jgi:hypothetical protein
MSRSDDGLHLHANPFVQKIRSVPATATAVVMPAATTVMRGTAGVRYAAHRRLRQATNSAARSTELRTRRHWHAADAHRSRLPRRT